MNKTKLVVGALLTGEALNLKQITEKISSTTGESFKVQSFSALINRLGNEKVCDLGYFIIKTKAEDGRYVYRMAEEALDLSEDQAFGLCATDGDYDLGRALNDFPKLKRYVPGELRETAEKKTEKGTDPESADAEPNNSQDPVYVSPRSMKSFGQEYRIYPDRLELECHLAFHTFVIPLDDIVEIEVRPELVIADIFRGKGFKCAFALKMDGADLCNHVAIERKRGFFGRIRFTPDDPEKFVAACKTLMGTKARQ